LTLAWQEVNNILYILEDFLILAAPNNEWYIYKKKIPYYNENYYLKIKVTKTLEEAKLTVEKSRKAFINEKII